MPPEKNARHIDPTLGRALQPGDWVRDLVTGQAGLVVGVECWLAGREPDKPRHWGDDFVEAVAERVERLLAERRTAAATPTRLVPVSEAASMLGRSVDAVYKMIARGQIRAVRSPGGR